MRLILSAFGLLAVAACAPTIPDSGAGLGFTDHGGYASYMRSREVQARGAAPQGIVPPPQVHSVPARPADDDAARAVAAAALASVAPNRMPPAAPEAQTTGAPLSAIDPARQFANAPAEEAPRPNDSGTLVPGAANSMYRDEVLDMDTARATRDSERERFEERRAAFTPVAPTAVPDRPDDVPNIVAFALSTTNRVGEQVHRRSRLTTQNHARNCSEFVNPDRAQEEFLRRGGPERDPLNLDPDGDGFACHWSPEPFRAAARAARN